MQKTKRIIAFIMVIAFIYGFIPVERVQAVDNINIISTTSVTAEEAKLWAKNKGATSTFINLADIYWKYYQKNGNVNPAIAYVQAAKETGYGKFGGVIDESYHNPCGLKTTTGGGDYEANAHQRFANWDQGVQAHLDHLALYAGVSGYPRSSTYDPRHFKSIAGTAKTVVELGQKWAPSSNYGAEIMNLYTSLMDFSKSSKILGNVDEPTFNQSVYNTLTVRGWVLNLAGIEKVKVYVNNVYKGDATLGLSRPDIEKVYGASFKNAATSGFKLDINIANLAAGNNTVKVEAIGKDGATFTQSRNINVNKPVSLGIIDEPAEGKTITGNSVTVRGWAIAASGIKEVKVYANGQLKNTVKTDQSRPDIKNTFPSYPNAEKSGYSANIDISNLSAGNVTIKVDEVAVDGSVRTSQRTVRLQKAASLGIIDEPTEGKTITGNSVTVRGWAIAASGIKEVKIYANGQLKKTTTTNQSRPDIKNAFPGYPNAEKSGYSENIDISNLPAGNVTIKVDEVAVDGSVRTSQRTVRLQKPVALGIIDEPTEGKTITSNSITVRGWAIAPSGVKEVKIYVDGVLKKTVAPSQSRPDIKNAFPGYPNAEKSGYSENIDVSNVASGNKTIKVVEVAGDGSSRTSQKTVRLQKPQALGIIDEPTEGKTITGNSMTVRGWAIAPSGMKEVKIYVNNVLKTTVVPNQSRPDIKNAFPGYPNAETSGYSANIDVTNVAAGNVAIKVVEVAKDGSLRTSLRNVKLQKPQALGVMDEPRQWSTTSANSVTVRGWAIAPSGVKQVKIYVNGVLKKTTTPNKSRPDIKNAFPGYPNAETSGYEEIVDVSGNGSKTIKLEAIANDGTVRTETRNITVKSLDSLGIMDSPSYQANITGSTINVSGWSLSSSGVKEVKVYVNGKLKGSVAPNVVRTDVNKAFPSYTNAAKAGYSLSVNIDDVARGNAVVKTEEISNNGTSITHSQTVNISRKSPIGCIDSPTNLQLINSDTVAIGGWASNDSKLTKVNVYVDNVFRTVAAIGGSRPDVQLAYPNYRETKNSGYSSSVNLTGLAHGKHTIKVEAISIDGTVSIFTRDFYYKKVNRLVVVDPGHNYGGDDGAYATFGSTTYCERDLNMAVAMKTKALLEAKGYNVVLTRDPLDYSRISMNESLAARANLANSLNADVFVSIHQNSYTKDTAHGTEVFYTKNSPDSGYPVHSGDKLQKSTNLAQNIVNGISSSTGFYNRGAKFESLFVLRNTKMPSVLVECGFISNQREAESLATESTQSKIAQAIANGVSANF